ncbi:MAG: DUF3737 family protein [Lachnospiraceae bacterium]|nr:DUF3737 family protein [Lachnospiraceae bacterium]
MAWHDLKKEYILIREYKMDRIMTKITGKKYEGERSLFMARDLDIEDTIFGEGESPLKESRDIKLYNSMFKWKYPLWYSKDITVKNCSWFEMARAGVWYTENISIEDSVIEAPKNFRRCKTLSLKNVSFSDAKETLWNCEDVTLTNVTAKGTYFGMNTNNIKVDNLTLYGDYSFDGGKNIEVRNSKLLSKDAFWNCENVVVYDSFISGEYLGWNSKNLTFINCTIESLQGMCYIENLVMKNCKLLDTTLSFEYSTVDVEIKGHIDSVKNPISGSITADSIGELIMEEDKVDVSKTHIKTKSDII